MSNPTVTPTVYFTEDEMVDYHDYFASTPIHEQSREGFEEYAEEARLADEDYADYLASMED